MESMVQRWQTKEASFKCRWHRPQKGCLSSLKESKTKKGMKREKKGLETEELSEVQKEHPVTWAVDALVKQSQPSSSLTTSSFPPRFQSFRHRLKEEAGLSVLIVSLFIPGLLTWPSHLQRNRCCAREQSLELISTSSQTRS